MSEATVKQINFAKDIAEWFGVELPKERTKEAYSAFLNKYADDYKREMRGECNTTACWNSQWLHELLRRGW